MNNKSTVVRAIQTTAPVLSRIAPHVAARWLSRLFLTPQPRRAPAREERWLEGAEKGFVRYDGNHQLRTYTWGPPGPTVLLVHGWGGAGPQLGAFVAPLRAARLRVVAFDHKGHGESDGADSALPEFAQGILRVAETAGPLVGLVGHSLGCAAAAIAIDLGLSVDRAVFLAPPEDPAVYLGRAANFLQFTEPVAARTRQQIERRFDVSFERARITGFAHQLKVPLLVFHDRDDQEVYFWEGQNLVEAWPGARMIPTEGLGHRRIVRDPGVVECGAAFIIP